MYKRYEDALEEMQNVKLQAEEEVQKAKEMENQLSREEKEEIHGDCDILDAAIARYPKRIFPRAAANVYSHLDPIHRKQQKRKARKEMKTDPM